MAITITGTVGNGYNLTKTDTATNTGEVEVTHTLEDTVSSLTYTNASNIVVYAGQVGTVGTTIDLFASADANDGTYFMRLENTTSGISYTSILTLCVHNKSAGTITLAPGASNSFLTASEQITIPAGCSVQFAYGTAQTVSATVRNFKLTGSAINLDCEIYLLGN